MSLLKNKPVDIHRQFYVMNSGNSSEDVEVTFYGDVVEERPWDYWEGKPVEGNFIILKEFIDDLERLSGFKNITFRINSYGGDSTSGLTIHNRIKEMKQHTTCIIDGVAMSAASIIAVACDTVKVNPCSIFMIHKNSCFLYGSYNTDEASELIRMLEGYDKAAAGAYSSKTGLSETEIIHMMAKTTYLTGKEAVEKGFADELISSENPIKMSASADGRTIYMKDRAIHLAPGLFAPDNIPTREETEADPEEISVEANTNMPEVTGKEKGGHPMTKDELRAQYPELVAEVEADALAGNTEAISAAVSAERTRLQEIDEVASLFSNELVNEAKYGEARCSAEQLSYRAAKAAQKQGKAFLAQLDEDTNESNSDDVTSAPDPEEKTDEELTDNEKQAKADALFKQLLGKGKEV